MEWNLDKTNVVVVAVDFSEYDENVEREFEFWIGLLVLLDYIYLNLFMGLGYREKIISVGYEREMMKL